jgi:hypothetical protein
MAAWLWDMPAVTEESLAGGRGEGTVCAVLFSAAPGCLRIAMLLLLGAASAGAQRLHDETRLFREEQAAKVEAELAAFEAETGVRLHLLAAPFVEPGELPRLFAVRERRRLVPAGNDVLLLAERGQGKLAFSLSPDVWQRYRMADMAALLRAAAENKPGGMPLEEKLLTVARHWMDGVRRMELERRATVGRVLLEKEKSMLAPLAVLLGAGVLLLPWLAGRMRRRSQALRRVFELPEVVVGQRLGAARGGGVILEWPRRAG